MNEVHEALLVVLRHEAELVGSNLLIGRHVDHVVVVAVAVDVVGQDIRGVETAAPGLVDQAIVVAALVVDRSVGHDTVGRHVLRVMQTYVVRALVAGDVGECRRSVGTRHTGLLLAGGMRIGSHQTDPLSGLCRQRGVERPSVTLRGIVEHEGIGQRLACSIGILEVLIEGTVVGTVEAGETAYVLDAPVGDTYTVDGLVVDELSRSGEGERYGDLIVDSDRSLPNLRHLEVGVHGVDRRTGDAILRLDGLGTEVVADHVVAQVVTCQDIASELGHIGLHTAALTCGIPDTLILHHVGVGRHVGEEHEGQTAREEARTTTHLQRLVAEYVPSEAETRREGDAVRRPLASVDVLTVVTVVVDGLVGHQVVVVEEQTIETQTIGQFQIVEDVPVVLHIEAQFVELYAGSRIGLAVVTVGQGHDLRLAAKEQGGVQYAVLPHIVCSVEAVVTRTITHIHVVCHLVLETDTGSNLVRIHIIGGIILDVPDGVVHSVVPGKQFIAEGHVDIIVLRDINVGEGRRVGVAQVVEFRIGSQQLVGEFLREAAVQVERERVHHIVHSVHRIGKRH